MSSQGAIEAVILYRTAETVQSADETGQGAPECLDVFGAIAAGAIKLKQALANGDAERHNADCSARNRDRICHGSMFEAGKLGLGRWGGGWLA